MKEIKSRIILKHDNEINWNKASSFIPKQGEVIISDVDDNYSYERMKIGDGITNVIDLPFIMQQTDWNQNDETAINFIQNRPFGETGEFEEITSDEVKSYFVESTPWVLTSGDSTIYGGEARTIEFDAHTTLYCTPVLSDTDEYRLTFNGVEYTGTVDKFSNYTRVTVNGLPDDDSDTSTTNVRFDIYSTYIKARAGSGSVTGTFKLESYISTLA